MTPYEILDVESDADAATIKKAYRKAAMRWHPDRNPDDPKAVDRFKEIAAAYDVLSDPAKRAKLDRGGRDTSQPFWGPWSGVNVPVDKLVDDMEDLFSDFLKELLEPRPKPRTTKGYP